MKIMNLPLAILAAGMVAPAFAAPGANVRHRSDIQIHRNDLRTVLKGQKEPFLSPEFDWEKKGFTFQGWVALAAYSWNWTPIIAQRDGDTRGYSFGIDSMGHFGLQLAADFRWTNCIATNVLRLRTWYHLAVTYDPAFGVRLFLDGEPAGSFPLEKRLNFAKEIDLHMGRNHEKMVPAHLVRDWAKFPSWWSLDGLLDEIKIHDRALTAAEIQSSWASDKPSRAPNIPSRRFPDVAKGTKRFGAYPARLEYYEQWDALWQMGGDPDIVVKFDELPVQMVFWRGTRFSPCWVSENGKWMADQSLETGYPKLDLPAPVIQRVNLKSQFKPLIVVKPGSKIATFNGEVRREFSHFPWWNHWPVARISSDGRYAMAPDQAAHSSLSWVSQPAGAFLYGMTDKSLVGLLPLAKAWIHPPALKTTGSSFSSDGYNQDQRAYLLKRIQPGGNLNVELAGSPDSPVFDPALVIRGWGENEAALKIDGAEVPRGRDFRYGHRRTLDGADLVVWIKTSWERPVRIFVSAGK